MSTIEQIRVGVVEIGSRATRLLIADLNKNLQVIATDKCNTQLAHAISKEPLSLGKKVQQIISTTGTYISTCRQFNCHRISVFGTEAVRRLPVAHMTELKAAVPQLQILTEVEEARCSLLGAVRPFDGFVASNQEFIIDQGSGSVELAIGNVTNSDVILLACQSYRLGTEELVDILDTSGTNYNSFLRKVEREVKKLKLISVPPDMVPLILGSAATKLAWLKVRNQVGGGYEPAKVHGEMLKTEAINQMLKLASNETNLDDLQRLVDPRSDDPAEFKTVFAGLVGIRVILDKLDKYTFVAGAYGPRFGAAWFCGAKKTMGFAAV